MTYTDSHFFAKKKTIKKFSDVDQIVACDTMSLLVVAMPNFGNFDSLLPRGGANIE